MRIKIFIHPESKESFWARLSQKAVSAEILRKRYTPEYLDAERISDIDFDKVFAPDEKKVLLYIGYSPKHTPQELHYLASIGIHTLLLNYEFAGFSGSSSRVLLNYRDAMEKCICYLRSNNKSNIALFGINPDSTPDTLKKEVFCEYLRAEGKSADEHIYYNNGSIENCLNNFFEKGNSYDAIICANDVTAITLLRCLQNAGLRVPEDVYIISCSCSTMIAERTSPTITAVAADQYDVGVQAVSAYTTLVKNPGDIALTVRIGAKLVIRQSTNMMPDNGDFIFPRKAFNENAVDFYGDPIAKNFFSTENLLLNCDELDIGIINGIIAGDTYPKMAEQLYTSENVISYRIKRMYRLTGTSTKTELVKVISPYLGKTERQKNE
ncbi:MAG: substrate-binding domain-containing protein [Clostridia bacterium]|nr:substrate-binding domain-containing protein [Clostridia bacterium]